MPKIFKVVCHETQEVWNSLEEAAEELGVVKSTLMSHLSGNRFCKKLGCLILYRVVESRCSGCGVVLDENNWPSNCRRVGTHWCSVCTNENSNRRYHEISENGGISYLKSRLKYKYGISLEDYEKMLEFQNERCAICGSHVSDLQVRLSVDHNHETGKVRGLLCRRCNSMLGFCDESVDRLQAAIEYLERFGD